ncbi:S8 family serine peptidase [Dyella sp.]|jgi:subtilisin family serine protease|uniref:S8 family serine peptidase n=1 Tax=Dyella sp. TaxID=1869338 RepID=UPI002D7948C7|nr:S8 family serine peptidase [Dyella sp.]HET6431754.1 S8 family serine peptidase [Dyella sp.]
MAALPKTATCVLGLLLLVQGCQTAACSDAPARTVITSQAQLPRHSYALTTPTASALLDDEAAFGVLAKQVQRNTEATLRDFDIRDPQATIPYYVVLRNLALLRGDAPAERRCGRVIRSLETKPAAGLLDSLLEDAAATAAQAPPGKRDAAFRDALARAVEPMPWPVVQESLKGMRAAAQVPNVSALLRGQLRSDLDSVVKAGGRLSDTQANTLIRTQVALRHIAPYQAVTAAVLGDYLTRHAVARTDIWPARAVTLAAGEDLHPVRVAVWDEGVDVSLFPGRLYVNDREQPNGRDDDGNGYVDDIHGISFDERDQPAIGPMLRFDDFYPGREAELRALSIGHSDAGADRATPEAAAFRQRLATLKPAELAPLVEAGMFYDGYYSHGTHVAGIAMDGNPAARLLVVRYNSDGYHARPPAMTDAAARRYARNVIAIVAYLRAQHVRVVNMSFGLGLAEIEATLEANNVGATPAQRSAMAVRTLGIVREAFVAAMRGAPEILFVPGAGNSNTDMAFSPDVPAGIVLPNVLAVGAVDQYGDAASFTSYGKQVGIYANGFEVDSLLPGGFHERKSGTSMAAPQVTNLAAKLFALRPSLTPAQCIALIRQGATPSADGRRALLNPRRTVALLQGKTLSPPLAETPP